MSDLKSHSVTMTRRFWSLIQIKTLFCEVRKKVQVLHPNPNIPKHFEQWKENSIAWNEVVRMVNGVGEPGKWC